MNLALRGIDGSNIKWNPEGSFLNDAHKDLKADFVIANPPFNDSDWGGDLLQSDGRWQYGKPPAGNANFAWVQHFLYHLSPNGSAGFVLSNGSLSSNTSGEGDIRKALVMQDLVDCIVMLPTQLFYNTGIPACLWFLSRYKNGNKNRDRKGEVLFIDASELGYMVNRSGRAFTEEEIKRIADTYHEWKRKPSPSPSQIPSPSPSQKEGDKKNSLEVPRPLGEGFREREIYRDIKGFCKSATLADIEKHNFVLTSGRYVGIPDEVEDDVSFEDRMSALTMALGEQMREGQLLDDEIKKQLAKVGFVVSDRNVDF
jgi:type I restriction enzyme M protein